MTHFYLYISLFNLILSRQFSRIDVNAADVYVSYRIKRVSTCTRRDELLISRTPVRKKRECPVKDMPRCIYASRLSARAYGRKRSIAKRTSRHTFNLFGNHLRFLLTNSFSIQGWSRRLGTAHRIITVVWCRSTYVYVVQPYNLPLNLALSYVHLYFSDTV